MENKEVITLKPCTKEDIEAIYKMSIKHIERYEKLTPDVRKQKRSTIEANIKKNIDYYQRIYGKSVHLGYVYLHEDKKHIKIENFLMFETYYKKPLGQVVVDYLKELSFNYGKPLFLNIFKMDIPTFNLYFSQGFDVYECVKDLQVKLRYQPKNN